MAITKMTEVEFLNKVIVAFADDDEMLDFAKARLDKKNKANEKARAEKVLENEPIRNKVVDVLSAKRVPMTVTDIIKADVAFVDNGWSSSKVTSILTALKNEGTVSNTKSGKTSYYTIV